VTYTAGSEIWSFMPPEFYSKISRLRANSLRISDPFNTVGSPKDYGIDGPITALQYTTGGVAKTYIYATMRRGGRAIYAFDATNPATPTLLWKKGCSTTLASNADCSTDYSQIGQTWSSLRTMYATAYGSGASPLLITGGGYDTCEDYDAGFVANDAASTGKNHNCVAGGGEGGTEASGVTKGNRIFILDAATGNVVRQFKTRRAVIADVVILRDTDGKATYGYTADMGGYVYRLSLSGNATSDWTITTIASLGCNDPGTCTDSVANRKFMFSPSVLSLGGNKYSILLGSGDREKPVTKYSSAKNLTNYFFHIVDDVATATYYTNLNATCDGDWICTDALYGITTSTTPSQATLDTKPHGWYLGMSTSEQIVTNAITIFGVTTFSTHQPSTGVASACTVDLGTTRVYNIFYKNGQGVVNGQLSNTRYADVSGDGLPPSPIGGRVKLDDGTIVPFCMGCDPGSPEKPKKPTGVAGTVAPKSRLYWYIEK
jgi:type IV pilus assembly protein PilY1